MTATFFSERFCEADWCKSETKKPPTSLLDLLTGLMAAASGLGFSLWSGPAKIPVRTFEDVIRLGYKVISISEYYVNNLATAPPDSAKYQAYKLHFENGNGMKDNFEVAIEEAISDPGTLIYATELGLVAGFGKNSPADQLFALRMDDASHVWGGLALQKDSEFLGLFNYYLLKARVAIQ